jgi:hypothetical protein
MALFSLAALGGTGIGPVFAGWIEMNPHLEWRWIQWIQCMFVFSPEPLFAYFIELSILRIWGVFLVLIPILMPETRVSITLTRMAKKLRKETGDGRYRARVEDERASLRSLIYISCTRPICAFLPEVIFRETADSLLSGSATIYGANRVEL